VKIYDININALLNVVADMLGIKSASQAYDEGSIPFTRSKHFIDQFMDPRAFNLTQARWSNLLFCRIVYAKTGSHFSHNARMIKNAGSLQPPGFSSYSLALPVPSHYRR